MTVCHAISCAVELDPVDAPRCFCPVHWCCIPTTMRSPLRRPFDPTSVSGLLAVARAKLAIAELEERTNVICWLAGVVNSLERIAGQAA